MKKRKDRYLSLDFDCLENCWTPSRRQFLNNDRRKELERIGWFVWYISSSCADFLVDQSSSEERKQT
jgi:hypothetical protein